MNKFRKILSFLRWRIVIVRYFTMLRDMRFGYIVKSRPVKTNACKKIEGIGYCKASNINKSLVHEAQSIYGPRTIHVEQKNEGHPFKNIFLKEDITLTNPIIQIAFSQNIFDVAADYFGDKFVLDSLQVLYSYSTSGEVRESQQWHLDYGDRKSFHAIIYLNDVLDSSDGPFVFVDRETSNKIGRSCIVRRISDEKFSRVVPPEKVNQFLGKAGSMVYVDPAACYHYGSRCNQSRLAVFVTFSSWFPFVQPTEIIQQNRSEFFECAKQLRPDLSIDFLKSVLQIR